MRSTFLSFAFARLASVSRSAPSAVAHVQMLYRAKLDEGLVPKSVKYIHTTLHRALRQAIRWGLVPRNAAAEVDPPRVSTPEMSTLSPIQARTLLEAAKGSRLEALYVLAVTTGMRQGELLGLGWEDANLEARTVWVRRTLTLAKGGLRLTEPKTGGAASPSGSPVGLWRR